MNENIRELLAKRKLQNIDPVAGSSKEELIRCAIFIRQKCIEGKRWGFALKANEQVAELAGLLGPAVTGNGNKDGYKFEETLKLIAQSREVSIIEQAPAELREGAEDQNINRAEAFNVQANVSN